MRYELKVSFYCPWPSSLWGLWDPRKNPTGGLNTFANESNVDLNNETHRDAIGMLVVMDAILSRVARNKALGKRTWVYFDELWMMFRMKYTAELMDSFWKLVRKYGGFMTGITQNVTEVLESGHARNMLSNSEFVLMMNQSATDRATLAELLNISRTQLSYITNAPQGCGLMRRAGALVPFNAAFDTGTQLYRAMTTKMEEVAKFERERRNTQTKGE